MIRNLTCIECPMGCAIEVELNDGKVTSVKGNNCPRGKAYAESEVICPVRVVTSSVRMTSGKMLPVKTDRPVPKTQIFSVMKKVGGLHPSAPVHIGDILLENIEGDANLVATDDQEA